jgi:branched-chain amino acid transport system substrate-binding protein
MIFMKTNIASSKHGSFTRRRLGYCLFVVLAINVWVTKANAQGDPGVTASEIVIGSCAALDGPSRGLGTQTVSGAQSYINLINSQGGVNGRKIKLVSYDDGYDPEKAEPCFRRLIKEPVFAAAFFVGTPTALKHVPLAEENKIPLIGLFTGAQALYSPLRHYVINVRASYFDETREQVDNLWNVLDLKKIGVIHPEDPFGATVLEGVKNALKAHNSAPVAVGSYPRQTTNVDQAIETVRAAKPDAVVVVGSYTPVAEIVKRAHKSGWKPLFLTVSFVGTDDFIKEAGADAEGTVITQVVPPYYLTDLPTVALYRKTIAAQTNVRPSFVGLEGFVDAMVLVEGLKRAGKDLTRAKLISALEGIHNYDMGLGPKLALNYSPTNHKGFHSVYPTVVRGGLAVIFSDWKTAKPKP